ncbi:MAG: sensor domain-containing diguanylate cyclase [Nitrospirota bacterium]
MKLEYINPDHLTVVQKTIEGLADIKISIYDSEGALLSASSVEDPVLSLVTSSEAGKEEYNRFISNTIRTAAIRKDVTISEAPTGQHHFFVPCHINGFSLVIVGGAFFLSANDFEKFISRSAFEYRLLTQQIENLSQKIMIRDYERIRGISIHIQKLFYFALKNVVENRMYNKKYRRIKTVLRLLSNIEEDIAKNGLYAVITDILVYLFNVDSLSFLAGDAGIFRTVFSEGRLKQHISNLTFDRNAWIISEVIEGKRPFYYDDPIDLRSLDLNEQIESVYLFPMYFSKTEVQLLCVFNTKLKQDDAEEVYDLCQLLNFIGNVYSVQNYYHQRMKEMNILNLATSGLNMMFDKPEVLYSSIVDTAVRLSKAEKASLMLAENGREELSIKAVHGINKWLVKDLKIGSGEGIAGKVFKESVPVISKDIEKDFSLRKKPNYKTSSFMSIPLQIGEETIGVLNVSDKISGEVFTEEDLALIHYFANYASITLKSSSYYNLAEQMKELSITDSLTELFNRRYFQERLSEEIDRSERHSLNFSLCIIDIDDFKLFNDTEGHPAGDEILKRLSRLIHDSLRATDVLARIGGEEFAVIMPQTDKDEAYFVSERIRTAIRQKMHRTWQAYPKENITVSIGISAYPADDTRTKKLIWKADKALYRAKMHGKDKTFIWEEQVAI